MHVFHNHFKIISKSLDDVSEEQEKGSHNDIDVMKKWYQTLWNIAVGHLIKNNKIHRFIKNL